MSRKLINSAIRVTTFKRIVQRPLSTGKVWNFASSKKAQHRFYPILSAFALSITAYSLFKESVEADEFDSISVFEIEKHNRIDDCWVAIHDNVYDVTGFLERHPGGASRILRYGGKDASREFSKQHSTDTLERMKEEIVFLGKVGAGMFQQEEITEEEALINDLHARKPLLASLMSLKDFQFIAKDLLPKTTYNYFITGSTDEYSLNENEQSYSRIFFRPKILGDTNDVDTSSMVMGSKVAVPIYISSFAGSALAHPKGELNLRNAAKKEGIMQIIPKQSSYALHDYLKDIDKDQSQWFQYNFETFEEIGQAKDFFRKIESYPNIKGIFLNVDLADIGNRERDARTRNLESEDLSGLNAIIDSTKSPYDRHFTWETLKEFQSMTRLPIGLKGVQRGEDVVRAAELGVKAVILSNHGGRQLDFSRPPILVLQESVEMLKKKGLKDKIELYVDGGIRRGSDIIKALCLGANGVGLGRPFLFAMTGYGEEGVSRVVQILQKEVANNMKLLGVNKIEDLTPDLLDVSNLGNYSFHQCRDMPTPKFKENLKNDVY